MYPCLPPAITRLKNPDQLRTWFLLFIFPMLSLFAIKASAQTVTEVITDYGSYWKSSSSQPNAVKPDNSHNLLAFSYNGVRYSTGVNDDLLTAHGDAFVSGDYKALPVSSLTGLINSNTKIGLGALYDGIRNGPSIIPPINSLSKYLTDGIKGLDLGTCVANLPAGDLYFPISNISLSAIGDGIPDIIITQVADPSISSLDTYQFTDILGNRVGTSTDIILNNLPILGTWTADFYEAINNPLTLQLGFTQTDRPIRVWAADFSVFGINSSNIQQIAYFKIRLNGNSDVAFVAYNNKAFNVVSSILALGGSNQPVYNNPNAAELSVFPNPATEKLVIKHPGSSGTVVYEIKDVNGASLIKANAPAGTSQHSFNVNGLPHGTYFLTWNDGTRQNVKTFIKN